MSDEELRMDAYYYSFGETFQIEIDRILSAVACAGKAFHHTEDWNCEATPRSEHEGATPIDWIQNRANEAADAMSRLRAENEKMRAAMHEIYEVYAGGEGFIPQTSVEACLHERVNKIADIAAKHLLCAASKETE